MRVRFAIALCILALVVSAVGSVCASEPMMFNINDLQDAFEGAQVVDLRTSKVSSVVKLREVVKIPPPSDPVYVKTFTRANLPAVLQQVFNKPGIVGVTVSKHYVAIIKTDFKAEYQDTLAHELVHAYICLASPNGLEDFAFQEASAVYFSTNQEGKLYHEVSNTKVNVTELKRVQIADEYKQKLHTFQFIIEKVGEKEFYKRYRNAVITGNTSKGALLGLKSPKTIQPNQEKKPFPLWIKVMIVAAVVIVAGIGFYSAWQNTDESQ